MPEGIPIFSSSMIQRWRRPWLTRSAMPLERALGPFVAALSEHGLAIVAFGDARPSSKARFPDADLVEDQAALRRDGRQLAAMIDHPENDAGSHARPARLGLRMPRLERVARGPGGHDAAPTARSRPGSAYRGRRVRSAKPVRPTGSPSSCRATGS